MAKYQFKIEADDVDISAAVLAEFSVRNGRSSLNQGFSTWSANFRAFKQELALILATNNKDPDFVAPGSLIKISAYDSASTSWVVMFQGVITSSAGSANTFSFSCIDEFFFSGTQASAGAGVTIFTPLDGIWSSLTYDPNKFVFKPDTNPNKFPYVELTSGEEFDSVSRLANENGLLAAYAFNVLYLPEDRVPAILPNQIYVGSMKIPDLSTLDFELKDEHIDENYSIDRQADSIFNNIKVDWAFGSETVQDLTSINKLGQKNLEIDSKFINFSPFGNPAGAEAARQLGESLIQAYSSFGYSTISFVTSVDRLGLSPANAIRKTLPMSVIDSSAVTAPEFQEKMVVQQVEHRCSPDYWELDFFAANYRYVTPSQTWAEVTSNLKWSDVPSYLTWDMIRTKDL